MRDDLRQYCIPPDLDLKSALVMLDNTGNKILFVADTTDRLLGTLTDGDIRRWILSNGKLNARVERICNTKPFTAAPGYNVEEVAATMITRKFTAIPVVDDDGRLVDIVFWSDVFSREHHVETRPLGADVVIMAGGRGTRLDPFTKILPKPLIPIGDRTILEIIIDKFRAYHAEHFYITVNHKSKIIKSYFEELQPEYGITYVDETQPLGTAGSLRYLQGRLSERVVVTNCDIIIDADYNSICDYHVAEGNAITIVGSLKHVKIPYGVCEIEVGGQLRAMTEKPVYDVLVNTGMYVANSAMLELIPEGRMYHMTHLVEDAMARGEKVGVFPIGENAWKDTGEWEEYRKTLQRFTYDS